MKYAKTFDTIEEYHAEEDTFEYPHLSYILSGETVIIDLDEEEEEEEPGELEGARIMFNEAPAELMDTVYGIFMVQIEYGHYTDGDWVGEGTYMSTDDYTITSSSCVMGGQPANFDILSHGDSYECEILDYEGTTGHVDFTIAGDGWAYNYSLPVDLS